MESEKVVERRLEKVMKHQGGWAIKIMLSSINGLPDRLCLFPGGLLVFVELKTTKKKPEKLQNYIHRKLTALGFEVRVIDTTNDVNKLIKDWQNGNITQNNKRNTF